MPTRRYRHPGLAAAGARRPLPLPGCRGAACAQSPTRPNSPSPARSATSSSAAKDAKVTIIEYASMTCPHCAAFHAKTWPALKKKYIDTGKVRFILREFPLDPLRHRRLHAGPLRRERQVLRRRRPAVRAAEELGLHATSRWTRCCGLMKQAGFSQESFEACLKNQQIYDAVNCGARTRGADKFKRRTRRRPSSSTARCSAGRCRLRSFDKILDPARRELTWRRSARAARWPRAGAARDCAMKLTRLRLVGFKSFVEPTEFLIEPGLTGVVGPNGCGKSNLVEALRWVMGESSYKSLRASGMDDVIFSGSGNRPARNTAEVALVARQFRRAPRPPPSTTPTSSRSPAASSARRARPTASTAARCARATCSCCSPTPPPARARRAMVRQGQIGEIIAAKPQARRRILEEAAGIAGLHSRRHEAELRLQAAEENLARLEDVLQQIDGQVDSLKRQARQAAALPLARGRHPQGRGAAAAASAGARRATRSPRPSAKAEADVRAVAERTRRQAAAARDQAVAAHALPGLREAEAAAAAALQRLVLARDSLDAEEKRAARARRRTGAPRASSSRATSTASAR